MSKMEARRVCGGGKASQKLVDMLPDSERAAGKAWAKLQELSLALLCGP